MSQILIISDSHYLRKSELQKFIDSIDDIIAVIHCGDIYAGYTEEDFQNFYLCRGNNDFGDIKKVRSFVIDGIRFLTLHGHQNYYSYNPLDMTELLERSPADVICFGHTHVPFLHQEEHLSIINPGSLTLPRTFPRVGSYAIFNTKTRETHFYNVKTNEEIIIQES